MWYLRQLTLFYLFNRLLLSGTYWVGSTMSFISGGEFMRGDLTGSAFSISIILRNSKLEISLNIYNKIYEQLQSDLIQKHLTLKLQYSYKGQLVKQKIMSEAERKRKLLSKYASPAPTKIKNRSNEQVEPNIWMKDDDQIIQPSSSQSQQISQEVKKKVRVASSDQEVNERGSKLEKQNKLQKQRKKERKLKKKLRKALGIQKDAELQQFLGNLQVEGIEKQQILSYLKNNKSVIIKRQDADGQVKQENQNKKKKKKKDKTQQKAEGGKKFAMFQKSESSDIQIPEEARTKTIYRNKDGTIKQCSQKEEKQKRKKAIMQRLAEWEKGMKKQKSDDQKQMHEDLYLAKNNKIWNDPMKRWQNQIKSKTLTCKFEGPPNRYNIKPGFRWDGVVRGNGFQNRYLQQINLKKAKKDQEHMEYMRDL